MKANKAIGNLAKFGANILPMVQRNEDKQGNAEMTGIFRKNSLQRRF